MLEIHWPPRLFSLFICDYCILSLLSYQAGQLLFQRALILLHGLKLFLFALHIHTQLTDLLETHSIEHTVLYKCTPE